MGEMIHKSFWCMRKQRANTHRPYIGLDIYVEAYYNKNRRGSANGHPLNFQTVGGS